MKAIIPFLIYLTLNSEISILTKTKFGKCLPITLITTALFFYLFGFVRMDIGKYLIYIIVIIIAVYICIFNSVTIIDQVKEFIFTPGFYAFIILFIFTSLIDRGRSFSIIDDWSHWGVMAKEMFRLNTHYNTSQSLVTFHKSYPPFFTIVETTYCLFAKTFSEGMCLQALQIFSLSMFLPLIEEVKKTKLNCIFIVVLILMFGNVVAYTQELTYPSLFFNCIYVEWPMAIYLAYMFYLVIKKDFCNKKDYIYLCIALCGFILTKQISIAFYLLIIACLLSKLFVYRKKNIGMLFMTIIVPLFFLATWDISNTLNGVFSDFNTESFNYLAIFKYIIGTLTEYQTKIFSSFIDAIMFRPVIENPIKIPYSGILLVLSIGIYFLGNLCGKKKKDIKIIAILILVGGIGYAYSICLSYLYTFDASEALTLTMFNRYMLMYIVMCFAVVFYLVIDFVYVKQNLIKYICFLILILLLSNVETLKYNYRLNDYNKDINEQMEKYKYFVSTLKENEKVLLVWQHDIERITAYKYNTAYMEKAFDSKELKCNQETCNISKTDFLKLLSGYDYLYICDYDDNFINYWKLINSNDEPYNDTAYKIQINDKGITLNQAN